MEAQCYLNGEIVPASRARISISDIGVLRGLGIYDGMITHNRKIFMFPDHIARFRTCAEKMSLKVPVSDQEVEKAINELVQYNVPEGKEALIRILLTGGEAVGVIEYNPDTPTLFILVSEFKPIEDKYLTDGCSVMVVDYKRDHPEIKSTNYIETVLQQKHRKAAGALEIVYIHDGVVYEGGGSNVFIVKNNILITPKDEIVLGITRKVVLQLAKSQFKIEERVLTEKEFYDADEIFITGSFKEVVPVVKVGERVVGNGTPGPVAKKIIGLFNDFTRAY